MADRHASQSRQGSAAVARPRSGVSNVHRKLFQSQLTRRPTPSSSNSGEALRLEADEQSESSEIVVRDKNGEIELDDPSTPPFDDPEEVAMESKQDNEKERQKLAEAVKQHQIDQNSVPTQPEGIYFFRWSASGGKTNMCLRAELLEAVKASLRAKVAALSDDNWMFERGDITRNQ